MVSEPPASVQDEYHPTTNINNSTKDETSKPNNDKNKPDLEEEVLVVQSLPASRTSPSVASPSVTGKKAESTSTQAPKNPEKSSNNESKDKDKDENESDNDNNDNKSNTRPKTPAQKDQENKKADTDGSSSSANSPDSPDLIVVGQQVAQHRPPSNSMAQPPLSQENRVPANRVTQTKRRNTSKGNNQGGSGNQYQPNPPPAMQMYQNTLNFSSMSQYIHKFRNKPTAKKSNIPPLVESSSKKSTQSKSVASQPSLDDNDNDNDNVTPSSAGVPSPPVTTTNRNNGSNQPSRSQNKAAGPPRRARQTEQSFDKLKHNARTQHLYQVDESRSPSLEIYDIEATEPSSYPEPYPGQRPPAASKPNKNFPKNAPSSRTQFVNDNEDSPAHDPQPAAAIHQYHPHTNQPPSPPSPPTYQYQYRFRVQPPSSEQQQQQQQQQQYSQLPQKRKRYPIDHNPPPPSSSSSPFLSARAQAPPPQRQRQRPPPTKQTREKSPLYTGPPYRITRHGTQNAVTVTSFVEAENQRFLVLGEGETPYTLTIESVGKGKSFIIESDGSNPVRVIPLTKKLN